MTITVLVVEDEFLIRSLVADYLSDSGFDVHEAESGDEALDYLKTGAAVDVLFTDIELPGSMNGVKLAECARAMRPELPVVYASGGPRTRDMRRPRSARPRFLPKPYDPAEVCTLVAKLAAGGARARAGAYWKLSRRAISSAACRLAAMSCSICLSFWSISASRCSCRLSVSIYCRPRSVV